MSNDSPPNPRIGTRFGPYELRALLGRGGMGEVYEAYDATKDRTIALKLLPPQFARDAEYQERFRRESQAAARLQDPHIIPIHDWGEIDGVLYIDMRLVSGHNLRTLVTSYGPMPPARAVAIVEQVASALDAAHAATLIHRDVKPENILVTREDFAYLVDFGIAHSGYDPALTALGDAIGSYGYMAPERFDNVRITNRADVYSLACVLHEILTGEPPFVGSRPSQLIKAHTMTPPPRPSTIRVGIPVALDDVVARGMAKNPQQRYATAGDLARAARAALTAPQRDEATVIVGRALDPTRVETRDETVYRPVAGPVSERDVVSRTWPPAGQSVPSGPYPPRGDHHRRRPRDRTARVDAVSRGVRADRRVHPFGGGHHDHVLPIRGGGSPGIRCDRCGVVAAAPSCRDQPGYGAGVHNDVYGERRTGYLQRRQQRGGLCLLNRRLPDLSEER